jgi:hypothetical protein
MLGLVSLGCDAKVMGVEKEYVEAPVMDYPPYGTFRSKEPGNTPIVFMTLKDDHTFYRVDDVLYHNLTRVAVLYMGNLNISHQARHSSLERMVVAEL